ncbi:hypothetical protein [Halomonas binhaiensis]|uniref:Glycine zipper 2TM domain-containing protein n=1 Tax=Halomonas binhaiensis TaxID=2562282 RepID=A0A7U3HWT4_9GAMM|nr:hypothetical protein [Halomonas binhaiensis]QRG26785.1 hypothetical protein E4T21_21540 [Halomonas binhaiensis]
MTNRVQAPREVCRQVLATPRRLVQDPYAILGTAAGAVIGGVIGLQIGGGGGRRSYAAWRDRWWTGGH